MSYKRTAEGIFGGGDAREDVEEDVDQTDIDRDEKKPNQSKSASAYVRVIEDIINELDITDSHLFIESEWDIIRRFRDLPYHSRYLLARLVLRKPLWHPSSSFKYHQEIGEEGLALALKQVCLPFEPVPDQDVDSAEQDDQPDYSVVMEHGHEVIDLSLDDDDDEPQAEAGPSRLPDTPAPPDDDSDIGELEAIEELMLDHFARDEESMTLDELLQALNVDRLKLIVKATRTRCNKMKKNDIIDALLRNGKDQQTLDVIDPKGKAKSGLRQAKLAFPAKPSTKLEKRLRVMALQQLGKCLKINPDFIRFMRRLNIIFYRSTQAPTSLFLPSLLTIFKKRSYPQYNYSRTSWIWDTREDYLEYERIIMLEEYIDSILTSAETKTSLRSSSKAPGPAPDADEVELEPESLVRARKVKQIFLDQISPVYQSLIQARQEKEYRIKKEEVEVLVNGGLTDRRAGLERFEPGYVYTRMVERAASAFGLLREYEEEIRVLESLLSQRFWRRGKRGRWYTRRALVQTNYLAKFDNGEKKKKDRRVLQEARQGLQEALCDDDTHLVFRPGLAQRLQKLEKELRIPAADRMETEEELREAEDVTVGGSRIYRRADSLTLDKNLKPIKKGKENGSTIHNYFGGTLIQEAPKSRGSGPKSNTWKGKSIWKGRDGDEVNVETIALQHYENAGYKGFHCETRILTTLFALLFWDIIFTDVPGAFETAFQTAPLDIFEDCFYYARQQQIENRLAEINDGQGVEILRRHDDQYRPKSTWCIGVRWDLFSQTDLIEIIECLGGPALATVCRLFCQDYGGRASGVPDLVVWLFEDKMIRFVEVKGPGDTAKDNQKLWFDALLQAGIQVDLCRVYDNRYGPPKPKAARAKRGRKGKAKDVDQSENDEREVTLGKRSHSPLSDARTPSKLEAVAPRKKPRLDV